MVEIDERLSVTGEVLTAPDEATIRWQLAALRETDVESIAICLLHSFQNPAHEILIEQLARDYGVAGVVVGWPLNTDDTEGPQAKLVRREASALAEATGLDVRLWDERLTSFAADNALAGHYTRKGRKARQDAIAAADMLRNFLISNGPDQAPRPADVQR